MAVGNGTRNFRHCMQLAQQLHHKGATRHPPPITRLLSLQRLDSPSITPIVILTNYSLPRLPTQLPVPVIIRSLSINTTDQQLPLRTRRISPSPHLNQNAILDLFLPLTHTAHCHFFSYTLFSIFFRINQT